MKDAMKFYTNFYEHPPEPKFIVDSRIVQEFIEECIENIVVDILITG